MGDFRVERVAEEGHELPAPRSRQASAGAYGPLVVGPANDPTEVDADRIADHIVNMVQRPSRIRRSATPRAGSTTTSAGGTSRDVEASSRIRRSAIRSAPSIGPDGGELDADTSSRIQRASVGGQALAGGLRADMERAIDADLGQVRIHRDSDLAPRLSALAFTVGNDIHFGPGQYAPATRDGLHLLGHEVAHTVQQGFGPRRATIRRHYVPLPGTLGQKPLTGPAEKWKLETVVPEETMKRIRGAVVKQIPEKMDDVRRRVEPVKLTGVDPRHPSWKEVISQGDQVPAKARQGEVFINLTHRDYLRSDGKVDTTKVTSTVVHEMFHAISFGGHGLQSNFANLVNNAAKVEHSPDEAVTDMLAFRAYAELFGDGYQTAYFFRHSESRAEAVPNADVQKVQEAKHLPVAWTGEMVDVICKATGKAEGDIVEMYLTNPGGFTTLVKPNVKKIRLEWAKHLRQNAAAQGFVHNQDDMSKTIFDVMEEHAEEFCKISKNETGGATEEEQDFIRGKLAAAGVPMQQDAASPGVPLFSSTFLGRVLRANLGTTVNAHDEWDLDNQDLKLLDKDIDNDHKKRVRLGLRKFLAQKAGLDKPPPVSDHDGSGPPPPPGGGPPPPPGSVPGSPVPGTDPSPPSSRPNPGGYASPLDPKQVRQAATQLSIPDDDISDRLTVIAVPREVWEPGTTEPKKILLSTPFREYPATYIYGKPGPDKSLGDHLGVPADEMNRSAHDKIESFGGGGYEKNGELVLVSANRLGSIRTLLHEIGHWKQDVYDSGQEFGSAQPVNGFSETNVHNIVLEYHNVLLHENLDATRVRTSYRTVPSNPPEGVLLDRWPSWGTLLDDARRHPGTYAALRQIGTALMKKDGKYYPLRGEIRSNLIAEFYSDPQLRQATWAVDSMPKSKFA